MARKPKLLFATTYEAEAYLEKKAREDEDAAIASQRRQESLFVTPKSWGQVNPTERDALVYDFEEAMYEAYGCFPKANWMR